MRNLLSMDIQGIVLKIPAILIAFTFHEYAHAYMADKLGDKTPRFQGRLTFNPIAHIDPIGFLLILVAGFGWAKPVQTNPSAYKRYYKDDLKVSFAGPLANLIVALVFSIIFGIYLKFGNYIPNASLASILWKIIFNVIYINIILFFFNLIPLPGLDGFHILRDLFPKVFYQFGDFIYRYQMVILIIFIMTPISNVLIGYPTEFVLEKLLKITSLIAKI